MDWEAYYADGEAMVNGALACLDGENKPIRYINGRFKLYGEKESRWYYDITFTAEQGHLVIRQEDQTLSLPLEQVEYLKLRPYYFAACIGFKAFVFYNQAAIE